MSQNDTSLFDDFILSNYSTRFLKDLKTNQVDLKKSEDMLTYYLVHYPDSDVWRQAYEIQRYLTNSENKRKVKRSFDVTFISNAKKYIEKIDRGEMPCDCNLMMKILEEVVEVELSSKRKGTNFLDVIPDETENESLKHNLESSEIAGRMFDLQDFDENSHEVNLRKNFGFIKHIPKEEDYKKRSNKRKHRYKPKPYDEDFDSDSASEEIYEVRKPTYENRYQDSDMDSEEETSAERMLQNTRIRSLFKKLVDYIRKPKRKMISSEESEETTESNSRKKSPPVIVHYATNKTIPIPAVKQEIKQEVEDAMRLMAEPPKPPISSTPIQSLEDTPKTSFQNIDTTADMPALRMFDEDEKVKDNNKIEENAETLSMRVGNPIIPKPGLLQEVGGTIPVKIVTENIPRRMNQGTTEELLTTMKGEARRNLAENKNALPEAKESLRRKDEETTTTPSEVEVAKRIQENETITPPRDEEEATTHKTEEDVRRKINDEAFDQLEGRILPVAPVNKLISEIQEIDHTITPEQLDIIANASKEILQKVQGEYNVSSKDAFEYFPDTLTTLIPEGRSLLNEPSDSSIQNGRRMNENQAIPDDAIENVDNMIRKVLEENTTVLPSLEEKVLKKIDEVDQILRKDLDVTSPIIAERILENDQNLISQRMHLEETRREEATTQLSDANKRLVEIEGTTIIPDLALRMIDTATEVTTLPSRRFGVTDEIGLAETTIENVKRRLIEETTPVAQTEPARRNVAFAETTLKMDDLQSPLQENSTEDVRKPIEVKGDIQRRLFAQTEINDDLNRRMFSEPDSTSSAQTEIKDDIGRRMFGDGTETVSASAQNDATDAIDVISQRMLAGGDIISGEDKLVADMPQRRWGNKDGTTFIDKMMLASKEIVSDEISPRILEDVTDFDGETTITQDDPQRRNTETTTNEMLIQRRAGETISVTEMPQRRVETTTEIEEAQRRNAETTMSVIGSPQRRAGETISITEDSQRAETTTDVVDFQRKNAETTTSQTEVPQRRAGEIDSVTEMPQKAETTTNEMGADPTSAMEELQRRNKNSKETGEDDIPHAMTRTIFDTNYSEKLTLEVTTEKIVRRNNDEYTSEEILLPNVRNLETYTNMKRRNEDSDESIASEYRTRRNENDAEEISTLINIVRRYYEDPLALKLNEDTRRMNQLISTTDQESISDASMIAVRIFDDGNTTESTPTSILRSKFERRNMNEEVEKITSTKPPGVTEDTLPPILEPVTAKSRRHLEGTQPPIPEPVTEESRRHLEDTQPPIPEPVTEESRSHLKDTQNPMIEPVTEEIRRKFEDINQSSLLESVTEDFRKKLEDTSHSPIFKDVTEDSRKIVEDDNEDDSIILAAQTSSNRKRNNKYDLGDPSADLKELTTLFNSVRKSVEDQPIVLPVSKKESIFIDPLSITSAKPEFSLVDFFRRVYTNIVDYFTTPKSLLGEFSVKTDDPKTEEEFDDTEEGDTQSVSNLSVLNLINEILTKLQTAVKIIKNNERDVHREIENTNNRKLVKKISKMLNSMVDIFGKENSKAFDEDSVNVKRQISSKLSNLRKDLPYMDSDFPDYSTKSKTQILNTLSRKDYLQKDPLLSFEYDTNLNYNVPKLTDIGAFDDLPPYDLVPLRRSGIKMMKPPPGALFVPGPWRKNNIQTRFLPKVTYPQRRLASRRKPKTKTVHTMHIKITP